MPDHARSNTARHTVNAAGRRLRALALTLLVIEFLDELIDGARQVAWPLIRHDLQLSYTEIGLLLSLPHLFGSIVEPPLFLLGDTGHRRALILGGGVSFALAALLISASQGFVLLLVGFALFSPSSGAFVGLSQAALMDADETRREQNMARWALAGSLGSVAGSLTLGAFVAAGANWRTWFFAAALSTLVLVARARRFQLGAAAKDGEEEAGDARLNLKERAVEAWRALRRGAVVRWLALLEFADLMLDGLHGFLALYFVDVAGMSEAQAGLAIAVWTGVGLVGDFLLIPLLERVSGLSYLRWSVRVMLVLFPAFLLAPTIPVKLFLLALMGINNAGWYSILKAQLYASMPQRSGTVLALGDVAGLVAGVIPLLLGRFAESYGLGAMMWLLLAGPLTLFVALPRKAKTDET